jgi:DNA (cytosine-5)-methyltransferase 3A
LFFTFVEILEHIKTLNPKILFLQENVGSASKLDVGIMSRALGVYPVRINSSLVTAQLRDRYYWSNIQTKETMFDLVTDIPQPKDRGIMFKDIITDGYVERVKSTALLEGYISKNTYKDENSKEAQKYLKGSDDFGLCPVVYVDTDKHTCFNTGSGSSGTQRYLKHRNETTGMITLIYEENNELRCKTNTNKGYDIVTENDCLDLSFPTSTTRRGRVTKGKSPCLMESNNNLYSYKDGIVRTVNQIEMERLQGFPDGYTSILSKAKAGSLLGDGWTLPVIEHIFSFIKK